MDRKTGEHGHEQMDDRALADHHARDPVGTRASLTSALGQARADARLDRLGAVHTPDESLPEIIFIPGFLGAHLVGDLGERVWIDPRSLIAGDLHDKLKLPGGPMRADGMLHMVYDDAMVAWRHAGFVVHPFPFDFRRSVLETAQALGDLVEGLSASAPEKRFVIVAHSMGSIVACLYPYCDARWKARIARAIFLGGPVAGTFDPIDTVAGTHWFLPRVAALSRHDTVDGFCAGVVTWPGLFSLLPDPEWFAGAEAVYDAGRWPGPHVPAQAHLDEARSIKDRIRRSPLFEAPVDHLLSLRYRTADAFAKGQIHAGVRDGRGDGTVAARTASFGGARVYHVDYPHLLLPLDPKVIRGVAELARTGETTLQPVRDDQCEERFVGSEPPVLDMMKGLAGCLFDRFESGVSSLANMAWLFSPPVHEERAPGE